MVTVSTRSFSPLTRRRTTSSSSSRPRFNLTGNKKLSRSIFGSGRGRRRSRSSRRSRDKQKEERKIVAPVIKEKSFSEKLQNNKEFQNQSSREQRQILNSLINSRPYVVNGTVFVRKNGNIRTIKIKKNQSVSDTIRQNETRISTRDLRRLQERQRQKILNKNKQGSGGVDPNKPVSVFNPRIVSRKSFSPLTQAIDKNKLRLSKTKVVTVKQAKLDKIKRESQKTKLGQALERFDKNVANRRQPLIDKFKKDQQGRIILNRKNINKTINTTFSRFENKLTNPTSKKLAALLKKGLKNKYIQSVFKNQASTREAFFRSAEDIQVLVRDPAAFLLNPVVLVARGLHLTQQATVALQSKAGLIFLAKVASDTKTGAKNALKPENLITTIVLLSLGQSPRSAFGRVNKVNTTTTPRTNSTFAKNNKNSVGVNKTQKEIYVINSKGQVFKIANNVKQPILNKFGGRKEGLTIKQAKQQAKKLKKEKLNKLKGRITKTEVKVSKTTKIKKVKGLSKRQVKRDRRKLRDELSGRISSKRRKNLRKQIQKDFGLKAKTITQRTRIIPKVVKPKLPKKKDVLLDITKGNKRTIITKTKKYTYEIKNKPIKSGKQTLLQKQIVLLKVERLTKTKLKNITKQRLQKAKQRTQKVKLKLKQRQVQKVKRKIKQKQRTKLSVKQSLALATKQKQVQKTKQIQKQKLLLKSKAKTKAKTKSQSKLRSKTKSATRLQVAQRLTQRSRSVQRLSIKPKQTQKKRTIIKPELPEKDFKNAKAFNVWVKEKGKWLKVNRKPLTKLIANRLGKDVTDKTVQASYYIIGTKGKPNKPVIPILKTKSVFRKPKKRSKLPSQARIEVRKHRINTKGEKRGLTVARLIKKRLSRKSGRVSTKRRKTTKKNK